MKTKFLNLKIFSSKEVQRLIDIDPSDDLTPMAVISQSNEFLLSGPGGLGTDFPKNNIKVVKIIRKIDTNMFQLF